MVKGKASGGNSGRIQTNQPISQITDVYGQKAPKLKIKIVSKSKGKK